MANSGVDRASNQLPPVFIEGYFSQRIENGEQPDYGYPKNHLPEVTVERMTVATGFMAALKRK